MKKIAVVLSLLTSTLGYAADFSDMATVKRVTPRYIEVNRPISSCQTTTEAAPPKEKGIAGAIIGGVAGGLLGSRVGKGSGKVAAGAVGAAVGAVVGDRMQNDDTTADARNTERCTQRDNYQRVQEGYITVFSYNGHEFEEETETKYRVGQKVPVQVNAIVDQTN
ncbi:glycine zipper 2TM domain-containing protein [Candidatus Methylopumilus planktonicus]|uniref:glycine zipper 2TM domain-containing protein n=1 Tax=Candidatus Methylopumilus planktonicus TaxID=1581557 RepID=UPI00111E9905|nr:glycine zipper 2TM domain-containing protein [Candidatus Methylopumilus planktonicus]QDD11472.1 glycine zipper 2TM domain-containing protein [Candidatus Methylopumilus planktonicus]QDD23944.1 glycine zipper 2TM domain-containing protein [Candidatus Methylopumilus planktonicus]